MKSVDKKPTARAVITRYAVPATARTHAANVQYRQMGQILRRKTIAAEQPVDKPYTNHEHQVNRNIDTRKHLSEPKIQCQTEPEEEEEVEEEREDEAVQAKSITKNISPLIQRQPNPEEDEEQEGVEKEEEELDTFLQKKSFSNRTIPVNSTLNEQIQSLKGGGQPLAENERSFFEPRFKTDFSDVRVHNNEKAAQVAKTVGARAFTLGNDVVFGSGQYAPGTDSGRQLLAHEFTHVIQQGKIRETRSIQRGTDATFDMLIDQRHRRQIQQMVERQLARLEQAIDQQAAERNVPARILRGIIHYETQERGRFEGLGEEMKIALRDWSVTLGPGDVSVQRAADFNPRFRGRNWQQNPITSEEFSQLVRQLRNPEEHARILAQSMRELFEHWGPRPGRTDENRWKFAIAAHKSNRNAVGGAQEDARDADGDLNLWSDVSQHLSTQIVDFVNNVYAYSSSSLSVNPYL